jgi:NAD(P)H-hydrate repair Nnr-like enzyme with NAD(P)H-hydrate dehydratase domain
MENTNWLRQAKDKPLFEDVLWSRPETKGRAGKLLIVGGNLHGFAAPAAVYAATLKAGIGSCRIVLPDSTQKMLGKGVLEADFVASTSSGSFGRPALAALLENAEWSDGVLLAGDLGRNSETAILLDSFLEKYKGQLTLAHDSLDYFLQAKSQVLTREKTLLVINLGKLQKLAKNNRPRTPILHSMNLHELVTVLADWSNSTPAAFITRHADNLVVAHDGRVSTTPYKEDIKWQVELAAYSSVWWLQQPDKPFEALVSAIYSYAQD